MPTRLHNESQGGVTPTVLGDLKPDQLLLSPCGNMAQTIPSSHSSRRAFVKSSLSAASGVVIVQAMPGKNPRQSPASQTPLRFGVNYLPRKNWYFCWLDWDAQSVAEDFEAIRTLGLDHVRVHLVWPLIQPGPSYVSELIIEHVASLLEQAERADLDVELTVLDGWLGGGSWMFFPAWTAPFIKTGNLFTSPEIIEAEKLLFRRLADTAKRSKRFLGFDLGNELTAFLNTYAPCTQQEATSWSNEIFQCVNQAAPGRFHVMGVDRVVWWSDVAFSRNLCAHQGSASIVHSYPKYSGDLERYGYSRIGTLHLVEYNVELAYAYHTDLGRRVWVEELGVSAEWMPESFMAEYVRQVLSNAADTGVLWGFTWWASHDIDPALTGFPSHEMTFGLIDQKNRPKSLGRIVASVANELREKTLSSVQRRTGLVIPDTGLSTRTNPPDWTYGTAFMNLVAQGKKPCIVLENRKADEDYLRSRGIAELIPLSEAIKKGQSVA